MEIYMFYVQVSPLKASMILLMLYLIHIKCLKRQYSLSNFEHLDVNQCHFHQLAV